ncbi:MAG TPA: hypothetical protein ENJ00_07530 [Phycisphaerales bacterium]|nr:hypothetical protein [Phycisphaerales bacterium]
MRSPSADGPLGSTMVPARAPQVAASAMTRFELIEETDSPTGWMYRVRLEQARAEPRELWVTMSFQDYEHWSGGIRPPADVLESLLRCIAEASDTTNLPDPLPDPLPERFDAARVRRWIPSLDDRLRGSGWP